MGQAGQAPTDHPVILNNMTECSSRPPLIFARKQRYFFTVLFILKDASSNYAWAWSTSIIKCSTYYELCYWGFFLDWTWEHYFLFNFPNYLVILLKGYAVPISYRLSYFALIFELLDQFHLSVGFIDAGKTDLKAMFKPVRWNLHTLGLILDVLVPKSR